MSVEVGRFYWVRLCRDGANWRPAERVTTDYGDGWMVIGIEVEYYDSEVNEVGPEITLPQP